MKLTCGHKTDTGRVRSQNQDSVAVLGAEAFDGCADGMFIVADGMGGHAGGEIASRVTVETVSAVVQEVLSELTAQATTIDLMDALREGIQAANEAVYKQARANPELRGMGTTCVAVLAQGEHVVLGHVGDSRAYLLHNGEMRQITDDHSLVQEHVRAGELTEEEARGSRYKNVITRAVGIASAVEPDMEVFDLQEGDTLLLCSDGLSGMVRDEDIAEVLRSEPDTQRASERLIEAANANGGSDNITAVVVRYGVFVPATKPVTSNGTTTHEHVPVYTPATETGRRVGLVPFLLLLALTVVLGTALVLVGREDYEVSAAFPFLRHKPAPKPVEPAKPPTIDFARLEYDAPVAVTPKAVRGAPIACDAAGNVFATTLQTGKIVRIGPDGKVGGDFAVVTAPAADTAPRHWASDPQGNLYVSSRAEGLIYKYNPDGTRIAQIGKGDLNAPEGIAVDGAGNLYVVDGNRLLALKAHAPGKSEQAKERGGEGAIGSGASSSSGGLSVEDGGPKTDDRSQTDASADRAHRPSGQDAPITSTSTRTRTNRTPQHPNASTPRRSGGSDGSR